MKKISVVLAVFNEEENLKACLESVKDLAWEIVVVDGGSTDKTLEIAKAFGARTIQTNNPPVFHINKNKAIDAARGDWILQLDADEIVGEDLAEEIKGVTGELLSEVLVRNKILASKGEWRRLVLGNGVHDLNKNSTIIDQNIKITENLTLKIGKKKFVKILAK